jgi:hypothetical protein
MQVLTLGVPKGFSRGLPKAQVQLSGYQPSFGDDWGQCENLIGGDRVAYAQGRWDHAIRQLTRWGHGMGKVPFLSACNCMLTAMSRPAVLAQLPISNSKSMS